MTACMDTNVKSRKRVREIENGANELCEEYFMNGTMALKRHELRAEWEFLMPMLFRAELFFSFLSFKN